MGHGEPVSVEPVSSIPSANNNSVEGEKFFKLKALRETARMFITQQGGETAKLLGRNRKTDKRRIHACRTAELP